MKYQRGVALSGLIFWGVIIAMVAVLGMKVVPTTVEYYKILKDVKATVNKVGPDATVADVRRTFDNFANIDQLDFKPEQLNIQKDGGKIVASFDYDKRIPLFANVSLLINYKGSSTEHPFCEQDGSTLLNLSDKQGSDGFLRDKMGYAPLLDRVYKLIAPYLNVDAIIDVARRSLDCWVTPSRDIYRPPPGHARVGVFMDRVFSFYYPENLEALISAGAELVFIDSLKDDSLPDVDGLYMGGGFPEFFGPKLEANRSLRENVAAAVEHGLPVYAECAGLMYLCRRIQWQGEWYAMAGVLPADVEMDSRPQGHGYVEVEAQGGNPLFSEGRVLRGHEFTIPG